MTEREIIAMYRDAKNKSRQIQILAEMNTEREDDKEIGELKYEIVKILAKSGELKMTGKVKRIILKATKEQRKQTFVLFSNFISDCLTEMDKVSPAERKRIERDIIEVKEYLMEAI